ncbi:DinB family protein [Paenibacillus sp. XY044]|uniref:DinB family protein n=1 Tax=Paenibacillus sp. XY044 TaxID=2026089 RepID=UPI000B992D9F|nr:DinB family protein [Paenibacillus sp. XY044]OZB96685.1 hypothetical protein CJP46_12530 [Paenibacillus sp. XY044]
MLLRPTKEDYNEGFEKYVRLVPEGKLEEILNGSLNRTTAFYAALTEEKGNYRYAPGKWSLKEVLGHITDNERIMSYRLLRIARGDTTPLSGYDEELLMEGAAFDRFSITELLGDFATVRRSTLTLLRSIPDEAWTRRGIVNGYESTAAAWAYILTGHEIHHYNVIQERYI